VTLPAIVLAGGKDSPAFAAAGENPGPGLAEIHGRPMVAFVVDALRATPGVGPVVLVARQGYPTLAGVDRLVPAAGSMVENLNAGLEACGAARAALLTTADSPFLTPAAVADFARRCGESGAGIGYAVIARAASEARFPGMRRTYARVADGEFTGGNMVYLERSIWPSLRRLLDRAHEARKKPWLLGTLLGPRILWRYLRHTVTIAEVEARISQLLGGPGRAIVTPYPELGADIDDPVDLALARRLLGPAPAVSSP
jgi:molybdopterin-guanine dinucleotide biosynthesis protein A